MAKKIAKIDADAMNSLYAAELTKVGVKIAATDDNGQDKSIQAFEDHTAYIQTLEAAMKNDKNIDGGTDPNDKIAD
jgi:hypothetical protein